MPSPCYYDFTTLNNLFGIDGVDGAWDLIEQVSPQTGELNAFYGKKHSAESKARMSKAATKRMKSAKVRQGISKALSQNNSWCFTNPEGCVIDFTGSLNQFCKKNGLNTGAMSQVHKRNYDAHKGWRKG